MVFAWGKPSRATMLSVAQQRTETLVAEMQVSATSVSGGV
jgi:hypothetical protein